MARKKAGAMRRYNIELPESVAGRIEKIQERLSLTTAATTIRVALALLDEVSEGTADGDLIIRRKDGTECKLILVAGL